VGNRFSKSVRGLVLGGSDCIDFGAVTSFLTRRISGASQTWMAFSSGFICRRRRPFGLGQITVSHWKSLFFVVNVTV
jgi:hypothetical protein